MAAVGVVIVGTGYLFFGLANFQPGFPKIEGVASLVAGAGLLASVVIAKYSLQAAFLTVLLATLPLVAWFAFSIPVQQSSSPHFFWLSLVSRN